MRLSLLPFLLVLSACFSAPEQRPAANAETVDGRQLLERYCASCHAIDRTGRSRHHGAPEFRTLSQRYPVEALAESLAEGIVIGHPDMPEIMFGANEVAAIISYLESIQVNK